MATYASFSHLFPDEFFPEGPNYRAHHESRQSLGKERGSGSAKKEWEAPGGHHEKSSNEGSSNEPKQDQSNPDKKQSGNRDPRSWQWDSENAEFQKWQKEDDDSDEDFEIFDSFFGRANGGLYKV
ncbi:hypothetical protein K432DRAFT_398502 [Lepidopterella palustris CBS 459.81]|uniref:Uncharacterized protein n=1 Tax=Lepidopterella palustris CBS 459.81 TaxID=1314670 RepID=A0A8E2DY57_9PEZI|nr:hypothetical protein K432DRAFT_398502 [Lepidopterella palustris CBS 459.81]